MHSVAAPALDRPTAHAVVTARDLVRRYGEGDTAVDALRGVVRRHRRGQLTAVMGPSGSGKSTLMHILAGLDRPTVGQVTIAGQDITHLDDNDLTLLRRDHIGFIFQFFNLLPMLTAEENIVLPLKLAGGKPDAEWLERAHRQGRPRRPPQPPPVRALRRPAAARRGRPRARLAAERDVRRRADRQPRLDDQRRDPRPAARLGRHARPDDRDGHPRRARRGDRRPRAVPRRRRDRRGPRPRPAPTRSSRRSRR